MDVLRVDEQHTPSAALGSHAPALEMMTRAGSSGDDDVLRGAALREAAVEPLGSTQNALPPLSHLSHHGEESAEGGNALERVAATDDSGDGDAAAAVQALLDGMVLHTDEMIENLPHMHTPELKMLGKCISFSTAAPAADGALQRFYYTGLVSMIEVITLVLMHVHRYTEEDYKHFLHREAHAAAEEAGQQPSESHGRKSTMHETHREADTHDEDENNNSFSYNDESDAHVTVPYGHHGAANRLGSPLPESQALDEEVMLHAGGSASLPTASPARRSICERLRGASVALLAVAARHVRVDERVVGPTRADTSGVFGAPEPQPSRRVRLSATAGSAGPLPYVSFARTSLHNVRLTRDRRSTELALFQQPGRDLLDVQHLRVFVRRYLAHTSQGSNPRRLPLRAYVAARCACPDVSDALLRQVAAEEVRHLLLVDRASSKAAALRENMWEWRLQQYAAPVRLFQHTGVLFLTGLPQLTCVVSAVALLVVVLYGVWFGMGMGILANAVTYAMVQERCGELITAVAVAAFAGFNAPLHSIHMSLPLRQHFVPVLVRAITSFAAIACCIMSSVVCASSLRSAAVQHVMQNRMEPGALCAFYAESRCSGYATACPNKGLAGNSNPLCPCAAFSMAYAQRPCRAAVDRNVRIIFGPLLAISFVLLAVFFTLQCLLFSMHVLARELRRVRDRFGIAQQRQPE